MRIGERIRAARAHKKVTQSELARRLGKTRQYLFQIENDVHMPGADLVADIARALGVSGNYLLGLSDELEGEPALAGVGG
jgi:transcriptional regulator with XRE-family HTH domain